MADFTNGTGGRVGLSCCVWGGAGCFSDFIGNMWGIFGGKLVLLGLVEFLLDDGILGVHDT